MRKTKREWSPEFKREAFVLLESSDRPLMQAAAEVGISPSVLRNWRGAVCGGGDAHIDDDTGHPLDAVASKPGVGDHAAEA